MLISTSFLSSKNPPKDIKELNETDTDYIHVDIMDGKFVKNKTMPFREMKKIDKYTTKRLDVHLMVEDAYNYIKDYASLNSEYITIHVESNRVKENLLEIKNYGIKTGIALNPTTPVKEIVPYLPLVNQILIMSVEPGEGGQAFLEESIDKIKEVKVLLKEYKINAVINIDGGINDQTRKYCKDCDIVVGGSYIINSDNFQERINKLR